MSRSEMRNLIRKFKGKKGLQKKNTKGAFSRPPEYIMDNRKNKVLKKSQNTDIKEVTKDNIQPVATKVVKEKINE